MPNLRKIYLIDHSLRGIGGHHYQYAYDILREAERRGHEVVLGTHKKFQPRDIPRRWKVINCFPYDGYSKHAAIKNESPTPLGLEGDSLNACSDGRLTNMSRARRYFEALTKRSRRKQIAGFEKACERLFRSVPLAPDDQVFFSTISEFDLLGLVRYLRQDAHSLSCDWHLQFHFDIYIGHESEHESQDRKRSVMETQISHALSYVPEHRFRFYSTTKKLVEQYNSLGVAKFEHLVYPVSMDFEECADVRGKHVEFSSARKNANQPIRVTCAGHLRREKGRSRLTPLLEGLGEFPIDQPIEIVIQDSKRFPGHGLARKHANAGSMPINVTRVPHPLSDDVYKQLIAESDLGLFLYNSRRYYSRCSGVLLEMMCSGIPVLVPANSWLSDQLLSVNQSYLQSVSVAGRRIGELLDFQGDRPIPENVGQFLIEIDCQVEPKPGTFVKLRVDQFDDQQRCVGRTWSSIRLSSAGVTRILERRNTRAVTAQLSLMPVFQKPELPWHTLKAWCIESTSGECYPLGTVGLSAANPKEAPRLLQEMIRHLDHYQATAVQFARQLRTKHNPASVLDTMIGSAVSPQLTRAAA